MDEVIGPYRASLSQGKRRTVLLVLVVMVALFGSIAWSSYRSLNRQRGFLAVLESGHVTPENFFEFAPGIACGGEGGSKFGPSAPGEPVETTCRFIAPDGSPIGTTFTGDPFGPGFTQELIDEIRPQLIDGQRKIVAQEELSLAPRRVMESRIRTLGVLLGIVVMVLLGATFFGAEVRWGVWPTLLTHEPRRGVVLASKFAALWTLVLIGFALTLAVVGGVDAVMRAVSEVDSSGGPSAWRLAEQSGWALLSLELYATIAAALALTLRTSIAGAAALLLVLGDHLLVRRYTWLRHFLPTEQIASLIPEPAAVTSGYQWFPRLVASIRCDQPDTTTGFLECREILLRPPPHWRASLVVAGWAVVFAMLGWAALRSRDVPL